MDGNTVTFNVELPGARRTHELRFKLGDTVKEKHGCIKVKTAVDGDGNDMNVWVVMKTELDSHEESEEIKRKLNNEIGVLKLMDNRHVLKLFQVFASEDRTYVLTEQANVTLAQLVQQNGGRLNPHLCGTIFNQLVSAVSYVHSKGLAHRNIHPESVLLDDTKQTIRLAEFEHAILQSSRGLLKDRPAGLQTPYTAPELREGQTEDYHGKQADAYSVVCVLYYMLTGKTPPLDGISAADDALIPDPVKDLVRSTLTPEWKRVDGSGRYGLEDIKGDGWVCSTRRHSSAGEGKPQVLDAQMLHRASHQASGVNFTKQPEEKKEEKEAALKKGLSVSIGENIVAPVYDGMSSPESLCDDSFSPLPRKGPRVFGEMIPAKVTHIFIFSNQRKVAFIYFFDSRGAKGSTNVFFFFFYFAVIQILHEQLFLFLPSHPSVPTILCCSNNTSPVSRDIFSPTTGCTAGRGFT